MAENLEQSKAGRAPVGWGFWLLWVLATAVGWAVGGALGCSVGGAVGGAITGIALVWLLRQPLPPGRGIMGVIDGSPPKGVEDQEGIAWRKSFLRTIGYKL